VSCHKDFGQGQGGRPCKNFPLSKLDEPDHHAKFCYWMYVEGLNIWRAEIPSVRVMPDPLETRMCYHAEVDCSRSEGH